MSKLVDFICLRENPTYEEDYKTVTEKRMRSRVSGSFSEQYWIDPLSLIRDVVNGPW